MGDAPVPGPGAAEPLAGVAGRAREQQSPERACARERGRGFGFAEQNTLAQPGSHRRDHREAVTRIACELRSSEVGLRRKPRQRPLSFTNVSWFVFPDWYW